jgi:hypothetical protein
VSYDSKSYDLAEHFLSDEPRLMHLVDKLAQHIQTSVEDWIAWELDRLDEEDRKPPK